jgi:murein DD-endopeptidase MepM/ murein hydrolase activator NlpD
MRTLLLAAVTLSLAMPASALAQGSGGTGPADPGAILPRSDGGTAVGEVEVKAKPKPKHNRRRVRSTGRPVLSHFAVSRKSFFIYGRRPVVTFRVEDRSRTVRVKVGLFRPGSRKPLRSFDLGELATGATHTYRVSGSEGGVLPQGDYELRLSVRDPGGRTLRRTAQKSGVDRVSFHWHRFPIAGPFSWGGPDGRFGAARPGHSHQGQDLVAAEGTPLVAVRGGTIQQVGYQAAGAGHYVILDGDGEERDYAYMHMQTGSIKVAEGQRVTTGQVLGAVGSSGESSGPHLHFEVWEGGDWWGGGHPVDPLLYLQRWDSWS